MDGVLLAGGLGSRLHPLSAYVNKHLLAVHDKPMIFYPLSNLLLAGVERLVLVLDAASASQFDSLVEDLNELGVETLVAIQPTPAGIVDGVERGLDTLERSGDVLVALGDNFFFGPGVGQALSGLAAAPGATAFATRVADPTSYGIVELDSKGRPISIEEKPLQPRSSLAVTGLYHFDSRLRELASTVGYSKRGEREISDLLDRYLILGELDVLELPRSTLWADLGTVDSVANISEFVRVSQSHSGAQIGCIEEICLRGERLTIAKYRSIVHRTPAGRYRAHLERILSECEVG